MKKRFAKLDELGNVIEVIELQDQDIVPIPDGVACAPGYSVTNGSFWAPGTRYGSAYNAGAYGSARDLGAIPEDS